MSNAYVNKILFGHSKTNVDAQYVRDLLPLMLTETRMTEYRDENAKNTGLTEESVQGLSNRSGVETLVHILSFEDESSTACADNPRTPTRVHSGVLANKNISISDEILPLPSQSHYERRNQRQHRTNSLFWAIYESEHPEDVFMNGTRANTEINHRLKVVTELKKTPKRLKETNAKLTIEQTQALIGSMMVAKEDKLDFCIAYSAYYNKPIMVVYQKTYCLFSPMVDVDIKDEDVILLYANMKTYSLEQNVTKQIICDIVDTKVASPLKAMSHYKTPELDEIAEKFGIETKQSKDKAGKEKRRKKEDIYNDVKVAIHTDQN
jgi:hypothetical protein